MNITISVWKGPEETTLSVPWGSNLREVLLRHGLSPYTAITRNLNCGGRGLCATCGVWIEKGAPSPDHWHDALARRFGYARLSCQVTVNQPMQVRLDTEKKIWGKPRKRTGTKKS